MSADLATPSPKAIPGPEGESYGPASPEGESYGSASPEGEPYGPALPAIAPVQASRVEADGHPALIGRAIGPRRVAAATRLVGPRLVRAVAGRALVALLVGPIAGRALVARLPVTAGAALGWS